MKVAVVGAGVVGMCVAEALARRGVEVVLIDRGSCGSGASAGNAGWVTPGLSAPIAAPGSVLQALRWMPDPASPFLLHPVPSAAYASWLYRFWRASTRARHRAGMAALVALSSRALDAFDAMADAGVRFESHPDGLLFAGLTQAAVEREHEELLEQRAFGYSGELEMLDATAARALEPALGSRVAGAVFARAERHVRPESLAEGLGEHLRARGATIREHTTVVSIEALRPRWCVRTTSAPDESADAVVVAAGVATRALLAPLGVPLPLEAARGYSLTYDGVVPRPRRPVYLLEAKVGVSPFDRGVRLAGTLELGSRGAAIPPRRLGPVAAAAERYLDGWRPSGRPVAWAGDRPLTPDTLPAIGAISGREGLFVATGHGMLGVTLAPITGALVADAIQGSKPSLELAPFSPARFA